MRTFAARNDDEPGLLELRHQLANLSRHVETIPAGPRPCQQEFACDLSALPT